MNNLTAYTPLESLLLFQALVEHGTDPNAFSRISESLKSDELIRDAETFDPGRLSSDALRELYLQVLSDDLRWEAEDQDADGHAGKKRKLQTPPLPSLKEANVYVERLPKIVDRLYEKYYDHIVRELREDERKFNVLQREIADIEREERTERSTNEDHAKTSQKDSQGSEPSQDAKSEDAANPTQGLQRPSSNPTPPNQSPRPEGLPISDILNAQNEAPVSPRMLQPSRNGSVSSAAHQRSASGDSRSRPSPLQPGNRQLPQPADQNTFKWEQYHGGPPHSAPQPYQQNSPYVPYPNQPPQYQAQPPPLRGSFSGSSSLGHNPMPQSPLNAGRGSPIVLPRPVGTPAQGRSVSPVRPLEQLADMAGQQFRPTPPLHVPQGVLPSSGFPYNPGFRHDGRPPSAHNSLPSNWQQLPPQGQYQQPYPPQAPYPPPTANIPPGPQYNSPYHPAAPSPGFMPPRPNVSTPLRPYGQISIPQTPATNGPSPYVKGSGTRYKPSAINATPKPPGSPTRHAFEPLSPVLAPTRITETPKKSSKEASIDKKKLHASRGTPRNRAGSVSSTKSHRSQSVMSHADELSLDEPNRIKRESATPAPDRRGKRKRSPEKAPAGPPTSVYWTRNFPKVSVSALETISAHRSAGTFATSVKEKDAPGYRASILRPQDLKSIKSAIMAGHRAAVALGIDEDWLPISQDIIPPKGIINYAQLEKELMRMFANAIMFNPDPNRGIEKKIQVAEEGYDVDGMVKDTRAMFVDVQKIVGELRLAEKIDGEGRGEDELDELAADEEGAAKRRRR